MQPREWIISARLARKDRTLWWTTLATAVVFLISGGFLATRVIPLIRRGGVVITHYTVYLGIDDVRPWSSVLAVVLAFVGLIIADLILAHVLYRKEPIASRVLAMLALTTVVIWVIASVFLLIVNT